MEAKNKVNAGKTHRPIEVQTVSRGTHDDGTRRQVHSEGNTIATPSKALKVSNSILRSQYGCRTIRKSEMSLHAFPTAVADIEYGIVMCCEAKRKLAQN